MYCKFSLVLLIRRKSRPPSNPTIPASIPVSPGPSLLSLEEAQARSKVKNSKMLLRRGSLDVLETQPRTNKILNSEITPKKRSWKGLFSRNKSVSDELDSYGENKRAQTLSSFKRRISYDITDNLSSPRSQSSYNLRELGSSDVIERPPQGKKGRKKKLEISSPLGVRTSSFVSYVGGMEKLERTNTAPALDLKETAKLARNRNLDKSKSMDANLHINDKKVENKVIIETRGDIEITEFTEYKPRLRTIDDVVNEETRSTASNDNDKVSENDHNAETSSDRSTPVDKKDIRNSIWIQKYDDIARTCMENMNVTDKENSPVKEPAKSPDNKQTVDDDKDILTMSPRHRSPEDIRFSLLKRGSRELQSNFQINNDAKRGEKLQSRAMSVEPLRNQVDLQKRASSLSEGGLPHNEAVGGLTLDWVPVMQRSLSSGLDKIDKMPGKFPVKKEETKVDEEKLSAKGIVTRKEWVNRPFSSYDNHPTPQTEDNDNSSDKINKNRPSYYDNLL